MRPTVAYIHLENLYHNLKVIQEKHPSCIAMVKANAYGHDISLIAPALALQGITRFGVASAQEAFVLQACLPRQSSQHTISIFLMGGVFSADELVLAHQQNWVVVLCSLREIEWIEKQNSKFTKPLRVAIKINSGMFRRGFYPHEVPLVLQRLKGCNCQIILAMSHLYSSADKNPSLKQVNIFHAALHAFDEEIETSLCNSEGISTVPEQGTYCRPGIALYGINVSGYTNLRPVMHLTSQVVQTHEIPPGEGVGYDKTWRATQTTKIGVVPIGYGDGYPFALANVGSVICNQKTCPVVGRVMMDFISIVLPADAGIGSPVTLWGANNLEVENVAKQINSLSYALLTGIQMRIPRILAQLA